MEEFKLPQRSLAQKHKLLLAPRLPVLGWMFKGKVPSTHHATDATRSKWIALITQRARTGNPNCPGILEIITNWPEGENFGLIDEEEQEQVTCAKEGPPYNQLPAEETRYALFTDGSCHIVEVNQKWKAAVCSPTRQVHKPLKEKVGQANLLNSKLFNWPWTLLKERSGQSSTSTLIYGWWPMLCGVGWKGGTRPTGIIEENQSGLLMSGKTLLLG
ncbi:hypothetical protein DUI87_03921 [Hirundo rustica rustica]|uniref:Uncharacterized protein n=1 Tax=Hirundo rustica rustica TaxID=333673 RepID=A0A3M0L1T3_HIRRU|nr:hypothetical protein DUI87_03921 [Hirundo rustica rustica]